MRKKKVVIKIGSSVIAPGGIIDDTKINNIVEDIVSLEKEKIKIIVVSSGAIVCGINQLKLKRKPQDLSSLQALASLGQITLMSIYMNKFARYNKLCAQILLTWDDFNDRKRYLNARNTLNKVLELGAIPIINENDTISTEEIKFGDNDLLSALVSEMISADFLLILSDVEGLMSGKEVIRKVEKIDKNILSLVKKEELSTTHKFTTGGMVTKLEAAKIATCSGIKVVIAKGGGEKAISRALKGEIGTLFLPEKVINKARKRWIAFSKKVKGQLFIDEGAKEALLKKGKSLLAVGITNVEGNFVEGNCVEVRSKEGEIVGCGIVNYSSSELKRIKGKRREKEVIHRDNFVKKEVY